MGLLESQLWPVIRNKFRLWPALQRAISFRGNHSTTARTVISGAGERVVLPPAWRSAARSRPSGRLPAELVLSYRRFTSKCTRYGKPAREAVFEVDGRIGVVLRRGAYVTACDCPTGARVYRRVFHGSVEMCGLGQVKKRSHCVCTGHRGRRRRSRDRRRIGHGGHFQAVDVPMDRALGLLFDNEISLPCPGK